MNSEQLRRIEENRRQALLKLQANSMANRPTPPQQHISHTPVNMPRPVQQVQQLVESTKRTVSLDLFLKSTQRFSIEPWLPDILQSGEFCRRFPADNRTFKLECFYEVVKYLQALKHPHIRLTLSLPPRSVIDHLLRRLRQTSGVQQRESHNNVSGFAFHNGRIDGNNSIDDGALRERLEPVISQSLLPYQLSGVSFAINNCDGRLLLADDMGLGKTVQAIAIATYYRNQWPCLIICPSSVRLTWAEALERWIPSLRKRDVAVIYEGKELIGEQLFTIISYEIAVRKAEEIQQRRFQIVIADESHVLKSSSAKRTRVIVPLLQKASRCILLSGTPALSRPNELFPQINAVSPKLFSNFKEYGVRYCNGHMTHFGWDFSGASHLNELQIVLSGLMIRRRKADVLTHLPPKTRETRFLSVPPLFKANSKLKVDLNEDENATPDTGTLNLWRETSAVKTPKAIDYVEALLTSNDSEPLILFAHHKTMLDALEDLLIKRRVGYIRIDGQVDSASRQQFATQFQDDPLCRVALLSITAAGVGLTLTRACLVLFVELYWNPGILMQAEDRAHRIGQVNPVTVRYLLAKNTIDDYIWPMLIKKLQILEQIGLSTSGPDKTSEFQPLPVTCVGSGNERQTLTTSFFPASNTAKQSEVDQFDSAFDAIDDMQLEAIMSTVEQKYK